MKSRWLSTAKGLALLAVAAATPFWDVTAIAVLFLIRHQTRIWDPASIPAKPAPGRPRPGIFARLKEWRTEIAVALVIATARSLLSVVVGFGDADLVMIGGLAAAMWAPAGGTVHRVVMGWARRRRWQRALAAVAPQHTPAIVNLGVDATGEWARVRIAPGATVSELEQRAEALAAWHAVTEVRVRRDPGHAGMAHLHALAVDSLAGPGRAWPALHRPVTLWQAVPVGVGEGGQAVTVALFEHNLLIGGEPGAGKSVAVHQLVAAAALDPTARIWLLDPKLVELAPWEPVAERFAGNNMVDATNLLRQAQTAMDDRYLELLAGHQRKVAPGTALHVVVIDELAHYLTWPERKARDAFTDVLRDLVSRGRAAGVIVIAATQKPVSDVIPTSLRDLFGWRWALRCTTPAASDTILGAGWATRGVSAASIDPAARGVGYLLHESGTPTRLRAFHLDDTTIAHLVTVASRLRHPAEDGEHG